MDITLFSRETCAPCKTIKYWFGKKKINYKEESIEEHSTELEKLGFRSAPVVKVGDKYFSNLPTLASYLQTRV